MGPATNARFSAPSLSHARVGFNAQSEPACVARPRKEKQQQTRSGGRHSDQISASSSHRARVASIAQSQPFVRYTRGTPEVDLSPHEFKCKPEAEANLSTRFKPSRKRRNLSHGDTWPLAADLKIKVDEFLPINGMVRENTESRNKNRIGRNRKSRKGRERKKLRKIMSG